MGNPKQEKANNNNNKKNHMYWPKYPCTEHTRIGLLKREEEKKTDL